MNRKKSLIPFFGVIVLFYLAANFAHPVTPTLIVERGLDSSMFGVALAAMMTVSFLLSPFWGKLCGYIPTRRIMLIGSIGYAVGQAIFGAATSEVMVVGGRMFAGIFTGGVFTSVSNYVVNTSGDSVTRGQNLTTLVTIQTVASAVGYFIGGMLGVISVEAAFIAQVVMLVICGFLFFALCEDDTPYKAKPEKALSIKEVNPFSAFAAAKTFMTPMLGLVFAIVAIAGIGQNSFEQCFNYYIKDQFGLSSAYNGMFKAAIAVVSLASNAFIGMRLQKKTDTNVSFLPIMACCTVPLCAILLFDTLVPLVAVDIIFFAFNAVRMPLLQNMAAMRTTPENSNSVMGFYQSMNSLGGIFGALFAGLIYSTNPIYPFVLAAAAFLIALGFSVVYVNRYKKEKKA